MPVQGKEVKGSFRLGMMISMPKLCFRYPISELKSGKMLPN